MQGLGSPPLCFCMQANPVASPSRQSWNTRICYNSDWQQLDIGQHLIHLLQLFTILFKYKIAVKSILLSKRVTAKLTLTLNISKYKFHKSIWDTCSRTGSPCIICRWFPQKVFSLTPLNPLIYTPFGLGMVLFFYSWVASRILHKKIIGGCPKSCLNSRVFWSKM